MLDGRRQKIGGNKYAKTNTKKPKSNLRKF